MANLSFQNPRAWQHVTTGRLGDVEHSDGLYRVVWADPPENIAPWCYVKPGRHNNPETRLARAEQLAETGLNQ